MSQTGDDSIFATVVDTVDAEAAMSLFFVTPHTMRCVEEDRPTLHVFVCLRGKYLHPVYKSNKTRVFDRCHVSISYNKRGIWLKLYCV